MLAKRIIPCLDVHEGRVVKGQVVGAAFLDLQTTLARHLQRPGVRVDTGDLAVVRQMVRHVAGAAANIQDALVQPRAHVAVQINKDRPGAAGKPPVFVFFQNYIHRGVHHFRIHRA